MLKKSITILLISILLGCGGGGGGSGSSGANNPPSSSTNGGTGTGVNYISVNTSIAQIQYPASYSTVTSNTVDTNPCSISNNNVNYPQSWNGAQGLPLVTGAPLMSGVMTAMMIKDILPSGSLPKACVNPLNFTEFSKTVSRLKELNVNIIHLAQWHWAQINADGAFKITGDTAGSLSDAELKQYVQIAQNAGLKVMLSNQIQGFVDNTGFMVIQTPNGNAENWGKWLIAFQGFMVERASKFQSLGIDYWEMGCNGCIYGDRGDGSQSALQQFSNAYLNIVKAISPIFKGKKYIYENSWLKDQKEYLASIDMVGAGLWTGDISSSEEANMSVSVLKSKYNGSGAVNNLASIVSLGKPVMLFAGIQSRNNALSLPGYMEETQCTNSVNSIIFSTTCIQSQTATNFALQAIVIEAQMEIFNSFRLPSGSIVGISDYWQTDFMSSAGPTFPNIASSIRNKPAEGIVKQWFLGH